MSVSRLVRQGHPNAWEYPWAVFVSAVDEFNSSQKE